MKKKMNRDVSDVATCHLCIGCGVCQSICPCHAIQYVYNKGLYYPCIDEKKCTHCGLCFQLCPGKGYNYKILYNNANRKVPNNLFVGDYLTCKIARTYDAKILSEATSGGIATSIIMNLLKSDRYDAAFCVTTYNCREKVDTCLIDKENDFSTIAKSRYIPVSQSEAISYILSHRDKKVILIGVSCFIQAVNEVIYKFGLDRTKLLLIGLFCDKNYNYNIQKYFEQKVKSEVPIQKLYFRTKEKNGWPGDIKIELQDQSEIHMDKIERIKIKDFYQMERCLYCLDKLNQFADISIGDNYTKLHQDKMGSSCIIIRTKLGEDIINIMADEFEVYNIDMDEITNSQDIEGRKKNLRNIILKEDFLYERENFDIKKTVPYREKKEYEQKKKLLHLGELNRIGHIKWIIRYRESKIRSFFLNVKYQLHDYKVRKKM